MTDVIFTNAQYVNNPITNDISSIRVEINGRECYVPLDANNTDYGTIQDLIASGDLVIAPANEN